MKVNGFNPSINAEGLIARALSAGRFPHAVIIEGGSPEERLTLANKIAAALVCNSDAEIPCGECPHCFKAEKGLHPDISIYPPRKENGSKNELFSVKYIREIRENAYIMPNEAEKKVYILTEAQLMNEQAQNAFLKILEEPPAFVVFILLASTKNIFIETILSRAVTWSLGAASENNSNKIPQEKLNEIADNICRAVTTPLDLELVKAVGVFEKDQELLQAAVPVIEEMFASALRIKFGAGEENEPEAAQLLAQKLSRKSLLRLIECTTEISASLRRHANLNLTMARMCSLFRAAVTE